MAQSDKTPKLTSVVSESIPHLRRGAMRDFLNIMEQHKYFKEDQWNRTNLTYTFDTGSQIEFFGVDMPSKVRGPRRDRLFVNEANNVPYGAFDQLEVRTRDIIFLDWNPTNEFWWYTDVAPHREHDHIVLTYKDNEALEESVVQAIEARRHNKSWWKVYGEGQLGEVESRVYTNWAIIDSIPHEARLERRGLDFGYTHDPTALVDIYWYNGGVILNERLYRHGMKNRQIAEYINQLPEQVMVIADSAEPKSIDEIKGYGVDILPCTKGKDSVKYGIDRVKDHKISMTKSSVNLIREYRNYLHEVDKNGRILNDPVKINDHLMDAVRYGLEGYKEQPRDFKKKLRRIQMLAEAGEL
jgi:phage terminase large subunit